MTEVYEFTKINAVAEEPARQIVSFSTDSGKKLWIKDTQIVRRIIAFGGSKFVAYDPATGLCRFISIFSKGWVDSIELIHEPQTGLKIFLPLRPSFFYLWATHPRYEELRKILEQSKAKHQLVWVGTFPGDSDIIDVRLPMP